MERTNGYVPDIIPMVPPTLRGRPTVVARTLFGLLRRILWPYGTIYIGIAVVVWNFFTPAMDRMQRFEFRWLAEIYVRNAVVLVLFVGAMHVWLYVRRAQGTRYKYDDEWLSTTGKRFLWRNQTRDNVFWSLTGGCLFVTAFEALLMWCYANDYIPRVNWSDGTDSVAYLLVMTFVPFPLASAYFYCTHRFLHWDPLYRRVHYLHHKNVTTGPWSGLAMHPFEQLLFFSTPVFFLFIPVSPFMVILIQTFTVLDATVGHSGFDRIVLRGGRSMPAGNYFHDLHHKYFECNYGGRLIPIDAWMGTWHDGTGPPPKRTSA